MKLLALALLVCALPSVSLVVMTHKSEGQVLTHCQDGVDKSWHAVGSKWRNSRCMDCHCSSCSASLDCVTISCCNILTDPRGFPDDCVKVFDPEACEYIVHRKDDPSVICPIYSASGLC